MDKGFGLTLARTDLIVGESVRYRLSYTNTGSQIVSFPQFGFLHTWLRYHLKDAAGNVSSWNVRDMEDSHEYLPPPMNQTMEIAPGKNQVYESNLMEVIKLPPAGKYQLWAEVEWPGGKAATPPVELIFRPMSLLSADIQPYRSGRASFQNIIWAQSQDRGSIVFFSEFEHRPAGHDHAELVRGLSQRILESPFQVQPMVATPPSRSQYPEYWLAWVRDGQVTALMEEYGKIKVGPFSHPLPGKSAIIRPILHDPAAGSCHFALWEAADAQCRLSLLTAKKDGTYQPGPTLPLSPGRLAWSTAFYPESRHRIIMLAVERQGKTSLERAIWPKDGASLDHSLFSEFPGAPLAASAFLRNDDGITGAVLAKVRHETGAWDYFVYGYTISPAGDYAAKQPVRLSVAKGVEFGKAFIEVGLKGDVLALMESTDGRWYLHASDGAKRKMAIDGDPGTPLGITWADDANPRALFWSPQRGFRFVDIVRGG
jgi:hypothetical protein